MSSACAPCIQSNREDDDNIMLTTGFMCLRCHVSKRSMHTDIIKQIMITSYWRNTAISRQSIQELSDIVYCAIFGALSCHSGSCQARFCHAWSCHARSYHAWSCRALSCHIWSSRIWYCQACSGHAHFCFVYDQCKQELLAFVNSRAEYRSCQAFAYRNCILNVYRHCWRL